MTIEELSKLSRDELVRFWVGQLALSIGANDFRGAVRTLIDATQREAYERGRSDMKAELEADAAARKSERAQ